DFPLPGGDDIIAGRFDAYSAGAVEADILSFAAGTITAGYAGSVGLRSNQAFLFAPAGDLISTDGGTVEIANINGVSVSGGSVQSTRIGNTLSDHFLSMFGDPRFEFHSGGVAVRVTDGTVTVQQDIVNGYTKADIVHDRVLDPLNLISPA